MEKKVMLIIEALLFFVLGVLDSLVLGFFLRYYYHVEFDEKYFITVFFVGIASNVASQVKNKNK